MSAQHDDVAGTTQPAKVASEETNQANMVDAILRKYADAGDIVILARIGEAIGVDTSEAKELYRLAIFRALERATF